MNAEDFARLVVLSVLKPTASDTGRMLAEPPGRRPSQALQRASAWYRAQSASDRDAADWVIAESARIALHGMMVLLDGARVTAKGPRGTFRLWYEDLDGASLVNREEGPMLHEAFAAEAPADGS